MPCRCLAAAAVAADATATAQDARNQHAAVLSSVTVEIARRHLSLTADTTLTDDATREQGNKGGEGTRTSN
ncbi:hypothetical protein JYU34_016231 [Plutella xylostella]|uniref:Secreted protein n=1 Tax=Plutella xylostella TaxID=51655 RepID=A0ABQ7Q3H8_PLUXY|nr:hypothetical protein JYU34_016231 [Plutella xylostella]